MSTTWLKPSRELPRDILRGRFWITDAALEAAERTLPTFRGPEGDHEGIAFLAGVELSQATLFSSVIVPESEHDRGRVFCTRAQVLASTRAARSAGLALLAQIHSHPAGCTYHSEGDDRMVLMPFAGMLSIVVPHYARYGLRPLDGLGVHQYQDGRWVLCTQQSVRSGFRMMSSVMDLR